MFRAQPKRVGSRPRSAGRASLTTTRARVWISLALLAFAALTALRLNETPVGSLTDDAYYIAMARSLAAGRGPVVQPGPDVAAANPGLFPSGFPLLLSPLARLWPHQIAILKLVPWLAAAALIALGWRLARNDEPGLRLALLAALALNPWLVGSAGRITSDLPFAAFALAALLSARALAAGRAPSWRRYAVVVALTGAAMLTRTVGLAVLMAIAVTLAARRRWLRAGIVVAGVAVTQLVLLMPGWSAGNGWLGDGYRAQILAHHRAPIERAGFMAGNLGGYVRELPVLMLPAFGEPVRARLGGVATALEIAVAVGLIVLIARGFGRRWRDDREDPRNVLLAWYAGFTMLALANFDGWPSGVQTRLLLPLLPALWWWALKGTPRVRARTALVAAALVASLAHNGWRLAHPLTEASAQAGRGFVDPGAGASWIAAHTARHDVLIAQEPLPRHVRLDRPVIALGPPDLAAMQARAAKYGARWLLLGPSLNGPPRRLDETGAQWQALLRQAGWTPVWSDEALAVSVYRIGD